MRETIAEKFAKISSSSENKPQFPINPLTEMKPYAYLADPNEPVISPDDWEINQDKEFATIPKTNQSFWSQFASSAIAQ